MSSKARYRCKCGADFIKVAPRSLLPDKMKCSCGGTLKKCGIVRRPRRNPWPMLSDAMGVHPDQIPEVMEHHRRHGVPTEFTPDGRAILTSRLHRKRLGELIGLFDRNGGYSDPQPKEV